MGSWDILLQDREAPIKAQEQTGKAGTAAPPPAHGGADGQARSQQIKAMFRAGYDYYMQHTPEKWQGLVFGGTDDNQPDAEYWGRAAEDINTVAAAFGNDSFIMGLLMELYDEMEREYQTMREGALDDGEKQSTGH